MNSNLCFKISKIINSWLDNTYMNKTYIATLIFIKKYPSSGDDRPTKAILRGWINNNYQAKNADDILDNLCDAGFLSNDNGKKKFFIVTNEGKNFLHQYSKYRMKGFIGKINILLKENLTSLLAFLGVLLGIINLFTH